MNANANSVHCAKQIIISATHLGRMSYFTSELMTLRVSPNADKTIASVLIQAHIHSPHTQIQSFWQSGHTKLMLWQIFLQTNIHICTQTHRDPDMWHFLWNEGGDISSTLGQEKG